MRTASLCFLLLILCSGPGIAALQLDGKVVELKPKPEDETISTIFTFTNKGSKTVHILGLQSHCSCLSATLDSASYAAGAKGVGTAEFKVGSFVGRHEKLISVQTDDPDQPEWLVTFVLDVPEIIKIEPRSLQWWIGDPPDQKTTTVTITGPNPMKITNITATKPNIDFSWKEITPGREYQVLVKPQSTKEVSLAALKIETDSKIPKYQRQLAFVSIYRKSDAKAQAATSAPKP